MGILYLAKILSDNTVVTKIPDDNLNRITIMGQKQITNKIMHTGRTKQ